MNTENDGFDADAFCKLTGVTPEIQLAFAKEDFTLWPSQRRASDLQSGERLQYIDALAIELARLVSDGRDVELDGGAALEKNLRLIAHSGAVEAFLGYIPDPEHDSRLLTDFFVGILSFHVPNRDRPELPNHDHRLTGYYFGQRHLVRAMIDQRLSAEEAKLPQADPYRELLLNVSAAARRLARRAAERGVSERFV